MQLTLSTGLLKSGFLPLLLPAVRQAGWKNIEITDEGLYDEAIIKNIRKIASDLGLKIPNWHLTQTSPFNESCNLKREWIEDIELSIEKGAAIGAVNHVLHWHNRFNDRRNDCLWGDVVNGLVEYARRLNVRLLMETVPHKASNERYVPASEIIEFVVKYPPEQLSVCLDINHSNLQEHLDDVISLLEKRLISIHVSDNDGISEKHWLPGQGIINFPSLLKSLRESGFKGFFVIEVNPWQEAFFDRPACMLKSLYDWSSRLMENGRPHPDTPELHKFNK